MKKTFGALVALILIVGSESAQAVISEGCTAWVGPGGVCNVYDSNMKLIVHGQKDSNNYCYSGNFFYQMSSCSSANSQ